MEYEIITPPDDFLDKFKHQNVDFIVDKFEEMMIQDILRHDTETLEKISRNVSEEFKEWMENKIKAKENVSINIKGETRSGKSLCGLSVVDTLQGYYDGKGFDTEKIVCANQKEYRGKLSDVDFGDAFQIDENAFTNVGIGSHTELQQLKDIQNIIAKKNIHTIYITPRMFLETNASMGLSSWGKDPKNWLTRFLVYRLTSKHMPLMGYLVVDVGKLFKKYGCYVFRELGGCTNPNKLKSSDLSSDTIKYSSCISRHKKDELLEEGKSCPFYEVCKHPLQRYEKKKDSWIAKEMEGGMDERIRDRFETSIKLFKLLATFDIEKNAFVLSARDGKQLQLKLNLYMGKVTATKYTKVEIDEIAVALKSLTNVSFFVETLKQLKMDVRETLKDIKGGEDVLPVIEEMEKDLPPTEDKTT